VGYTRTCGVHVLYGSSALGQGQWHVMIVDVFMPTGYYYSSVQWARRMHGIESVWAQRAMTVVPFTMKYCYNILPLLEISGLAPKRAWWLACVRRMPGLFNSEQSIIWDICTLAYIVSNIDMQV